MIIKIDVDGVIRDIVTTMCKLYNETFPDAIRFYPRDITDYNINKFFPMIKSELGLEPSEFFFRQHAEQIFYTASEPFEKVKDALELLHRNNHKIVIVTWQFNLENKENTLKFFDLYNLYFDDICFTRDKWMIYGDYLIDDNPEFILNSKDTSRKILIDAPYNNNINTEDTCIIRSKSLYDAVRLIIS